MWSGGVDSHIRLSLRRILKTATYSPMSSVTASDVNTIGRMPTIRMATSCLAFSISRTANGLFQTAQTGSMEQLCPIAAKGYPTTRILRSVILQVWRITRQGTRPGITRKRSSAPRNSLQIIDSEARWPSFATPYSRWLEHRNRYSANHHLILIIAGTLQPRCRWPRGKDGCSPPVTHGTGRYHTGYFHREEGLR